MTSACAAEGKTINPTTCACECPTTCTASMTQNSDCSCGCNSSKVCVSPYLLNMNTCTCETTGGGGTCSLSFSTIPDQTIKIGMDVLPFTIRFETTRSSCNGIPVFSLTQSLGFNATTYTDGVSGNILINGATLSNVGTYELILTAVVDTKFFKTSFKITV